jgi:hypothetical protein
VRRTSRQIRIDVAVVQAGRGGRRSTVSLLGEAKWGVTMGVGHLERPIRAREVLIGGGLEVAGCHLACFSGTGFSDALRERARSDPDVLLIGLSDLYGR